MSSSPTNLNQRSPLDRARRTRKALAAKLERAILQERDASISSLLHRDSAFHKAEKSAADLRRLLHRIRQNLQKKQMSIECQRRRLAATETLHAECVRSEEKHMKDLNEVLAMIEKIKQGHVDQLSASGG